MSRRGIERTGPPIPLRRLYLFLAKLALRHPLLLSVAILASFGVAFASILMASLALPLAGSLMGQEIVVPAWLGILLPLFDGLTLVERLRLAAGLLVGLAVVRGVIVYAEGRISSYLKLRMDRDLRQTIFDELLSVELRYIHKERNANLQQLLHQYPRQAADILDQYLSALSKTITLATYLVALFAIHALLTFAGLAIAGASLLAIQGVSLAVRRTARETNEGRVRLTQASLDAVQGMKLIRVFGREDTARKRFMRELVDVQRTSYKGLSLAALMAPIQSVVMAALIAGVLVASTYILPTSDPSWIATLIAFVIVMSKVSGPLQSFTKRRAKITAELPALEEIVRFLEAPKPKLREGARRFERLATALRFEGVSFAYETGGAPVLREATMDFAAGRTTAIVGASGSGKSTTLALLARLADPDAGRVAIDGTDLREYDSGSWRRRLAFVTQDNFVFNDTVRENLRFARPDADDATIEAAARRARAHDFILALDQGYDTPLGDRGVRLSGGQLQRLAIARALLADPEILVLDEATSALDAETERDVQEAIEEACRGRTVVVVAHRLATVRRAHRIHVLDAGRVVESGTHDELVAAGGLYARYVGMQDLSGILAPAALPDPAPRPGPTPLRVLLTSPVRTARIVNGHELATEVPVRVEGMQGERDALLREPGDRVVLALGSERAIVKLAGATHHDVAMFTVTADGREVPVRARKR